MIVADAYGIPRRFEPTARLKDEGGFLKHRDYSEAIGMRFEPGVTLEAGYHSGINDRRDELIDAMETYGSWVRGNR
jgi:hypothetical protein